MPTRRKAHTASDKGTQSPSPSQRTQRSPADVRSFGKTCLGGPTWLLARGPGHGVLLHASPMALSNLVPRELGHTDVRQTRVHPAVWVALAAGDGHGVCARALWPLQEACGRGGGASQEGTRRRRGAETTDSRQPQRPFKDRLHLRNLFQAPSPSGCLQAIYCLLACPFSASQHCHSIQSPICLWRKLCKMPYSCE